MTEPDGGGHPPGVTTSADAAEVTAPPLDLDALYRAHAGFVWRVVRRFGIDDASAEDVVHEVFMVARRRLDSFEGRGAPASWLYGIARGVVANQRRARVRAERRLRVLPDPTPESPIDEPLRRQEAQRLVRAFLAELPDEQRAVFELCDIEGLSGPETAHALGRSVNSVYSLLRLARRRLCAFLEEKR